MVVQVVLPTEISHDGVALAHGQSIGGVFYGGDFLDGVDLGELLVLMLDQQPITYRPTRLSSMMEWGMSLIWQSAMTALAGCEKQLIYKFIIQSIHIYHNISNQFLYPLTQYHITNTMIRKLLTLLTPQTNIAPQISQCVQLTRILHRDIQSNYINHYQIKHQFISLLQANSSLLKPDFFELVNQLNMYPTLNIPKKYLASIEKQLSQRIHLLTNNQLNSLLLFFIKADPYSQNSLIYYQFVKFYVGQLHQWIRVKYMVNLSEETIGSALLKLTKNLILNTFLSRKPPYERVLNINNIEGLLLEGMRNKKIYQSRVYEKTFLYFFTNIKQYYQKQMAQNLYHPNNLHLFAKLKSIQKIIVNDLDIYHLEKTYLRDLYIKLFIVIHNPQIKNGIYFYHFAKQYLNSQKSINQTQTVTLLNKFITKFQLLLQQSIQKELNQIQFQQIIILSNYLKKETICQQITKRLSPLLFHAYFQQLLTMIKQQQNNFLTSIINQNYDYFCELSIKQLKQIFQLTKNQSKNQSVCFHIIKRINLLQSDTLQSLQLQYILQIYSQIKIILKQKIRQEQILFQKLRVFLFRYISDYHMVLPMKNYSNIAKIIYNLKDWSLFNDQANNYPYSIFEQIDQYTLKNRQQIINQLKQHKQYQQINFLENQINQIHLKIIKKNKKQNI